MATKYWVGGAGTWNNSDTSKWSDSNGGASGAAVPTPSDDVVFNANSGLGAGGTVQVASTAACSGFSISGINAKLIIFSFQASFSFGGVMSWSGNSESTPILFQSNSIGTARTITCNGSHTGHQYIHFQDLIIAGSAGSLTGTAIGDCGGNSGITFTASSNQTWQGTSGGNWSDVTKWTSRVPLPQDNVYFDNAFSASQTVTADMPRLGKDIDWTGATGNPTMARTSIANTLYGSLTLISGMTVTQNQNLTLAGRASHTITSSGNQVASTNFYIDAPNGSYSLMDALDLGLFGTFYHNRGVLVTNGFNITLKVYVSNNSNTRTFNFSNSTITINEINAATVWDMTGTNMTLTATGSNIVIGRASANQRNISGGGKTYGALSYTVAGSTGVLKIQSGNNTFEDINFYDITNARRLILDVNTTTTITNSFNVNGTSGKLVTIDSGLAGTKFTLSKASGIVSCDYLSIKDSTAQGGASWYAGANSTNVSGNTGWVFTAPPTPTVKGGTFNLMGV